MNAKPTAHSAQSISQTLNHMGKLSMSREVIQLGNTIEKQSAEIRQLRTDAEFMAHVWQEIREAGWNFVQDHGDMDGVDFVAKRILGEEEDK